VDCREKGGIQKLFKDSCGIREEYFLEYDNGMIRKAEMKEKNKKMEADQRTRALLQKTDLFMITENDTWCEENSSTGSENIGGKIEENIRKMKESWKNEQDGYKSKAKKLGIHLRNKIKSTNMEFLMTSFLSLGESAEQGMKSELKNKKKSGKTKSMGFNKEKRSTELIKKLELFRGLETLSNSSSNFLSSGEEDKISPKMTMETWKEDSFLKANANSQDYFNCFGDESRKLIEQALGGLKSRTNLDYKSQNG